MFEIIRAEFLTPETKRFVIDAPRIARSREPGQFVIVRVHERGERIPLTIADADAQAGTITLIVQGVGKTTKLMNTLGEGEAILDVAGPLGQPSEVKPYGTTVVVGGGVGAAIAYPTAVALKRVGNYVISILGGRSRDRVILESEIRATSDEMFVVTDDGSWGERGLVTDRLARVLEGSRPVDFVLAIGPIPMMKAVAETTRPRGIKTVVSLNPLMVDGTGMCGGCRVTVGGHTQFACMDGPEFDAHAVDFELLARRNTMYRQDERAAMERFEAERACREYPPAEPPRAKRVPDQRSAPR